MHQREELKVGIAGMQNYEVIPESPGIKTIRTSMMDSSPSIREERMLPIGKKINPILREAYVSKKKAYKISIPVKLTQEKEPVVRKSIKIGIKPLATVNT